MADDLTEACLGVAQGLIPSAADDPKVRQLLDKIEMYQQGTAVRAEKKAVVQDQESGKDTQMKDTTQKDSQISKADALLDLGRQQNDNHQFSIAVNTLQEALELYQKSGDLAGIGTALWGLGFAHRNLDQPDQAIKYYHQAFELGERTGAVPSFMAGLLQNFGIAYNQNFEFEKALECFQKALLLFRNMQDRRGEANVLFNQGLSHRYLHNTRQANELFQQAIQISRSLRDTQMEANFNKTITFLEIYLDKK